MGPVIGDPLLLRLALTLMQKSNVNGLLERAADIGSGVEKPLCAALQLGEGDAGGPLFHGAKLMKHNVCAY